MTRSYTTPTGMTLYHVKQIGSGTFGVAHAVRTSRGDLRCLKEVSIKLSQTSEQDRHELLSEVQMMKECNHPNVIALHESWFERGRMCILMEYAPGGSLDQLIAKYKLESKRLPEAKVAHYVQELADALHHCHHNVGVIHRDIKPANILIDDLGTLKLGDFGLSRSLGPSKLAQTFCGSPMYMAPEQLVGYGKQTDGYGPPADMWALGCVVFELMALRSPWYPKTLGPPASYHALVSRITTWPPEFDKLLYPSKLIEVSRWLLQRRVDQRATAADLVQLMEMRTPPARPAPPASPVDNGEEHGAVEEARRIVSAMRIQNSFRKSTKKPNAQQIADSSAVIQRAVRKSLNRRRNYCDVSPEVKAVQDHRLARPAPRAVPVQLRRFTPAPECSDRLLQLAKPRARHMPIVERKPFRMPTPQAHQAPPLMPRQAWS